MAPFRNFACLVLPCLASISLAQNTSVHASPPASPTAVLETEAYLKPPPEIERLVTAPRWEIIALSDLSPDRTKFLVTLTNGMPSLASLGKAHKNLGGFQVDTVANRSRNTTIRNAVGLRFVDAKTGKTWDVEVPKDAGVSGAVWSPDGTMVAFVANFEDKCLLCVADAKTGKSRILSKAPLLATEVSGFDWTGDGKAIAAVFIPDKRMPVPTAAPIANEPKVRLGDATKHRFRTYPSLLETPTDMMLLEYYTTGQLALVDIKSGKALRVGQPAMIESVNVSPDGKYFRVRTLQKPFSYLVPVGNFGSKEEIWDAGGKVLAELDKRSLSLGEAAPTTPGPGPGAGGGRGQGAPANGKRNLVWRADGQGLSYIEVEPAPAPSQDGGSGGVQGLTTNNQQLATNNQSDEQGRRGGGGQGRFGGAAPQDNRKDRVMQWLPPFGKDDSKVVWTAENRISGVLYSQDCKTIFVSDTKGGNNRTYAVSLDEPTKQNLISSARPDEFYTPPGNLMTHPSPNGQLVVTVSSDGGVFLSGTSYNRIPRDVAPKPFLDKVTIKTGDKSRLFESSDKAYESLTAVLDDDAKQVVITRQSPISVPNAYLLDIGTKATSQLTQNKDVTPELTACQRFTLDVTRVDGFKFQVKVTLPASWKKGDKLPAIFWFYPAEFADQAAYDRTLRTFNRNAFPSVSGQSMALFTQLGYAEVEPDVPIVGPDGQMNNNYVADLQNSLYAIINKLDDEGMCDRNRLAISGHSYGAFSTANALVHTPYFRAGIAGSGDYNRSLTPFGFQNENRQFWDDRELYEEMSPFNYANQLNGALLMTHGMEDQNIGTNPINSERLFQALDQLGKPCALFMYPYEDHGQIARETVLDKWARWIAWMEKYVKGAKG
ncbi:MAG: prolyl oligopeptidase family serine peptidase [Fimbriimonadales bacterium]